MMAQISTRPVLLLVAAALLPGAAVSAYAAGSGEPRVQPAERPRQPVATRQLEAPQKSLVTLQPGRDATPEAVFVSLAVVLEDMEQEREDADIQALTALLAPSEIRCHLLPPEGRGEVGDDTALYSAEQVFYMLREYFDRVEVVPYAQDTAGVLSPGGLLLAEVPDQRVGPQGSPHGILHLSVESPRESTLLHERLYVGLRREGRGWRVGEIRQLP